jgi:hypothetical protein
MEVFEIVVAPVLVDAPFDSIGDAAFQRLEEQLDWTAMGWAQVVGDGDSDR